MSIKCGVGAEHAMEVIGEVGMNDDSGIGVLGEDVDRDLRRRVSMTKDTGGKESKNGSFSNSSAVGRFSGLGSIILLIICFNSLDKGAAERKRSLSLLKT